VLRLVSSAPDFFAHAGDAPVRRGEGFGCHCARCGRTISAPFGYERKLVWCLYCGMDEGYVPAVDSPWCHRWTFGITREEALEDREWIAKGCFEEQAEARARRDGRIIDLF